MAKPMVVVTRAVPRAALELLAAHATVDANGADVGYTPEELISHARNADAMVSLLTDRIGDSILARCPKLKVVANVAVADFAWALLLAVARNVVPADRYVRDGRFREWMMMEFHGAELAGRPPVNPVAIKE